MNYKETLDTIHSLNRFGIKPGLDRIIALLNELDNPQQNMNFIHVAGTNGKGSVSTMLSNIFKCQGKKTGLFISPFVIDFRERIQINGEYIPEDKLCSLTERVLIAAQKANKKTGDPVTEFEFITAAAFLYFKEEGCNMVVLETGLGGRLDSTNVITSPLANVITKISLDHTAVLGNRVAEIAKEKCGIIKKGAVVVTSTAQNAEALKVIEDTAKQVGATFKLADLNSVKDIKTSPFGTSYVFNNIDITTQLAGKHQIENSLTAAVTANALGVSREIIKKGIAETFFPARLEVISEKPLVLLDGAHNPNGAEALALYLDEHNLKPVTLMGMMKDKNCDEVLKYIAPRANSIITVTVKGNERSEIADQLAVRAKRYCSDVYAASDYLSALEKAIIKCNEKNLPLVICGSLYLASEIRDLAIKMIKN